VSEPAPGRRGSELMPTPSSPPRAFPESLCHRCVACRTVVTARSTFLMCTALPTKYPRQPVLTCEAFEDASAPGADDEAPPRGGTR
jgi:hypothetical protein